MVALLPTLAFLMSGPRTPDPQAMPAHLWTARGGLPNVLAKLRKGGPVRIAYFGGSITAAEGWRVKTFAWLKERYPSAALHQIDATIGGTGSDLAAHRCGQDVLAHKPDLVFVEFAVNDSGAPTDRTLRTMEGLVRQIWRANASTDICFVYTFVVGFEQPLNRGFCHPTAGANEIVAQRYGIPSINVALRIAQLEREGSLIFEPQRDSRGQPLPAPQGKTLFSIDRVHPLDAGHDVYARVVEDALTAMDTGARPRRHSLGKVMYADNWEDATLAPIDPSMLSAGWRRLSTVEDGPGKWFGPRMPGGIWEATKPGETLSFRFRGTAAALYDLMGPDAGRVICTVDGKAGTPISRFDIFCTYHRLANFAAAEGLTPGEHTVTVVVDPTEPDRSAVVDAEKGKPGFDPARYRGTTVRIGGLLVRGKVVGK